MYGLICQALRQPSTTFRRIPSKTYTTMSTVRASPLLGRLVHLNVLDDQITRVQPLGVGVGFGVA